MTIRTYINAAILKSFHHFCWWFNRPYMIALAVRLYVYESMPVVSMCIFFFDELNVLGKIKNKHEILWIAVKIKLWVLQQRYFQSYSLHYFVHNKCLSFWKIMISTIIDFSCKVPLICLELSIYGIYIRYLGH